MIKFRDDLRHELQKDEGAMTFINAALSDYFIERNKELFLDALIEVVMARTGLAKIPEDTDINRQHVYKMLSSKGNPSFLNIALVLKSIGFCLKVSAKDKL